MALDLVLIPNNGDVNTLGPQYIERSLLPGFLESCAAFRDEAGKPVYVREGYRSDETQDTIFRQRYYRVSKGPGVWYDGSYWLKRTGFATAAVPGSTAAKHRLGRALDLWSGIDSSFTSREHLIWVRVAKPYGWVNTGVNFGEPWHQENNTTASAGGTVSPFPESEEDELNTAEKGQLAGAFRDSAAAMNAANVAAAQASAAAIDAYQTRLLVQSLSDAVFRGGDSMPDKDGNKVGRSVGQSLADLRVISEATNNLLFAQQPQDKTAGRPSLADQIRNVYDGVFKSGTSIPT